MEPFHLGEKWGQPLIVLDSREKELHQAFHWRPDPALLIMPTFKIPFVATLSTIDLWVDEGFVNDLEKWFQMRRATGKTGRTIKAGKRDIK